MQQGRSVINAMDEEVMLFDDDEQADIVVTENAPESVVDEQITEEIEPESEEEPAQEQEPELVLEGDSRNVIFVHSRNCFRCTHLTTVLNGVAIEGKPITIKPFKHCYWKNGNENCPAKEIRIEIGVNTDAFVNELREREQAGDLEGVASMMSRMTRLDDASRIKVQRLRIEGKVRDAIQDLLNSGLQPTQGYVTNLGIRLGVMQDAYAGMPQWFADIVNSALQQQ